MQVFMIRRSSYPLACASGRKRKTQPRRDCAPERIRTSARPATAPARRAKITASCHTGPHSENSIPPLVHDCT